MKSFFLLILGTSIATFSQVKLKTYAQKIEKGYQFLADNNEYCPVSVKVDFTLNNMYSSKGDQNIFVVPARTKGYVLTMLTYKKPGKYGYRFKTNFNYGNTLKDNSDATYNYNLPFKRGATFKISQGYNGTKTHQNKFALDFSMPIGAAIFSIREGVVVKVVDNNTKTCYQKECSKFNNLLLVYHKNGTFSEYSHINTNSALVKPGDKITKGQLIAKSGNIGFSSGPHLHLVVFNQKIDKRETFKTKFKINDGTKAIYLEEKEIYSRNY
jgi:murein DD-endopeptidase MepM/ murein hydrolase activator NlpD